MYFQLPHFFQEFPGKRSKNQSQVAASWIEELSCVSLFGENYYFQLVIACRS